VKLGKAQYDLRLAAVVSGSIPSPDPRSGFYRGVLRGSGDGSRCPGMAKSPPAAGCGKEVPTFAS